MNPFQNQAPLPGVQRIVAVGSGKGGVGKSTLSFNLAESLKNQNLKVGLVDLDIYGPSLPRLSQSQNHKAALDENEKIQPLQKYGLSLMSMGYFIDEATPAVWRGPMLFKAIEQLLKDVAWPELDVLIADLPPGTGDVPLTLAQKVPLFGAIVVCTPQSLALTDAGKALEMFQQINVPVLGVVENMKGFKSPSGELLELFPEGDLKPLLKQHQSELLGQMPFLPSLAFHSEQGLPFSQASSPKENPFEALALKVKEKLSL